MMPWNTAKLSETTYFIEDADSIPGNRVVIGTIVKPPGDDRYHVEII